MKLFYSLLIILFSTLSFSQSTFVGLVLEEVDNGGIVDGTTYRLYAELSGGLVYSVWGDEDDAVLIQSTEDFYQENLGGDFQSDINPGFFAFLPTMEFDSWLTIGDAYSPDGSTVSTTPSFTAFSTLSSVSFGGTANSDASWFKYTTDSYCQPDEKHLPILHINQTDVMGVMMFLV